MSSKFPTEVPALVKKVEPQTYTVQKVLSGETYLVKAKSTIELEDEFSTLYYTTTNQSNIFLEPPYNPHSLLQLVQNNNVLNQCVEAMEVNIAGTGFEFVQADPEVAIDPEEEEFAKAFFNETYPNTSFVHQSRKLRSTQESVGYAYLEVLRTMDGTMIGLRNIETHNVRMVKLDQPILIKKKITRKGKDITLQYYERERRFAQRVALKTLVYYKEFGATRKINRNTGEWETPDKLIAPEDEGTELLIFGIHPDIRSAYFVPRWINQMPSVIGSRKAEEQNLEFLDAGGMPPAIIFVQGGVLAKSAADELRMYLSGQNKNKHRAVVVEAQSTSGSLDASGAVKVTVERFGAEQAQDAMFMGYDKATEEHVRVGFRLPPLFLGKAADFNFATAVTAYMVAEAQVFQPERQAFDEVINMTIMKELGMKTIKFHSLPITLKDVANQMKALELVKDVATRKSYLEETNKITGLSLELAPEPMPDTVTDTITGQPSQGRQVPQPGDPTQIPNRGDTQKPQFHQPMPNEAISNPQMLPRTPGVPPAGPKAGTKPGLKKTASELIDLAYDYATLNGLVKKRELSKDRVERLKYDLSTLDHEDMEAFNSLLATYTFGSTSPELQSIAGSVTKLLEA